MKKHKKIWKTLATIAFLEHIDSDEPLLEELRSV